MLDAVFLAATVAIFALVALVAKGVEKLGPPVGPLPPRAASTAPAPQRRPAAREDGDRS